MHVRPATIDDAEAIRAIYNPEVLESTVTFDLVPRSLAEQQAWLAQRSGAHLRMLDELRAFMAYHDALLLKDTMTAVQIVARPLVRRTVEGL